MRFKSAPSHRNRTARHSSRGAGSLAHIIWIPSRNWAFSMLVRYAIGALAGGVFVILAALILVQPAMILPLGAFMLLSGAWLNRSQNGKELANYTTLRPLKWNWSRLDPKNLDPAGDPTFKETCRRYGHRTVSLVCKRLIDVVLCLALLILALPLFILTAALIKFESPGPIYYRQARLGCDGRVFGIMKFRSIRADSDEISGDRTADLRITRVGRSIRRLHIDDLPQIFNVLWGDMSIVGPRPEPLLFATELNKQIPLYSLRLSVKPGITGWSQINFPYHGSVDDALVKLSYDLYYIERQSLALDFKIILATLFVAFYENEEKVAAGELIRRYGIGAELEATKRAGFMHNFRDAEGLTDWNQIARLIRRDREFSLRPSR